MNKKKKRVSQQLYEFQLGSRILFIVLYVIYGFVMLAVFPNFEGSWRYFEFVAVALFFLLLPLLKLLVKFIKGEKISVTDIGEAFDGPGEITSHDVNDEGKLYNENKFSYDGNANNNYTYMPDDKYYDDINNSENPYDFDSAKEDAAYYDGKRVGYFRNGDKMPEFDGKGNRICQYCANIFGRYAVVCPKCGNEVMNRDDDMGGYN